MKIELNEDGGDIFKEKIKKLYAFLDSSEISPNEFINMFVFFISSIMVNENFSAMRINFCLEEIKSQVLANVIKFQMVKNSKKGNEKK